MIDNDIKPSPTFYLPELDILRFFAFFAVYIHHSLPHSEESYQGKLAFLSEWVSASVIAGRFGVDLFFALSAFLITSLLIKENDKNGFIDAKAFYKRRILRIFPLYYFFVLLTIFVLPVSLAGEPLTFPHLAGFFFFAANWSCAFLGLPDSSAAALWSVSIEEQFYLIFPFLLKWSGVKNLKLLAVIFLAIAFAARIVLVLTDAPIDAFGCITFARLDPIAVGILLAVFRHSNRLKPVKSLLLRCLLIIIGIGGFIFAAKFLAWTGTKAFFLYPLAALSSGLLIWASLNFRPSEMKKFAPLIYLGRISYGLYVFHLMAIRLAMLAFVYFSVAEGYFTIWRFVAGLLISITVAVVSYKFLEKPFLKIKNRLAFIQSKPV